MRALVLIRDGHRCHWCGRHANDVDHLKPLCEGGPSFDPTNLVAACAHCNRSRGGKLGRQRQLARYGIPPPRGERGVWSGAIRLEENHG